jgi:hypothetical protein
MTDKDVMVLHNHTNSAMEELDPCGEPSPTSCDASQALNIKAEEVSVAEEEVSPVPITFPEIKTETLSSDFSDSSDSDNDDVFFFEILVKFQITNRQQQRIREKEIVLTLHCFSHAIQIFVQQFTNSIMIIQAFQQS